MPLHEEYVTLIQVLVLLLHRGAKTHERRLRSAQPKAGFCFRNWLWPRGPAFTCSCSGRHQICAPSFTPHSSPMQLRYPPSPKALGPLPADAIFIWRQRHSKKPRCASGLHYPHGVIPRVGLNARSSPPLLWSALSDTCVSDYVWVCV